MTKHDQEMVLDLLNNILFDVDVKGFSHEDIHEIRSIMMGNLDTIFVDIDWELDDEFMFTLKKMDDKE